MRHHRANLEGLGDAVGKGSVAMDIQLRNIHKRFNTSHGDDLDVLHDISLDIHSGQVVCLEGPSGSGKTTLLSILGCLFGCTSGKATIGGTDITRLPDHFRTRYRRELTGFVHQNYNLISDLTVFENISLPLYPLGIGVKEQKRRVQVLLDKLSIQHRKEFIVETLSGGEQQRVAIARALINNSPILLADEPTAHLDHKLSEQFMEIIRDLKNENKTVVLSSHDPFVTKHELIDKLFTLNDGQLIDSDPIPDKEQPQC